MRFIHTADLHLGMEPDKGHPWSGARARELWDAFENMINECSRTDADILLIAGDLFHRQPLVRELKEANSLFASIPKTRIVVIAGNHDYISGTSGYRRFEWAENVHFIMSDTPESLVFDDINTEITGFSFCTRDIYEAVLKGIKVHDTGRINILIAHGGEASKAPTDWKELGRAGFDYVAMGHLHKPQDISDRIKYCGSLEPVDKNENGMHGFIRGEIQKNGAESLLMTERVNSAKRQYIKEEIRVSPDDTNISVRGRVRELIESRGKENYYILNFTGEYDPQVRIELDGLNDLGFIVEMTNEMRPRLDFETLARENAGNAIGLFINSLYTGKQKEVSDEKERAVREKALYYGVQALTGFDI